MPLRNRRGAATLDYVLLLGAVLPLGGLCLYYGARVLRLAYDMICALVGWPFM
jgi:hypothetical protein